MLSSTKWLLNSPLDTSSDGALTISQSYIVDLWRSEAFPNLNDIPLFTPTSSKEQKRWQFTPAVSNDFMGEKIKAVSQREFLEEHPLPGFSGCVLITQITNPLLRDKSMISLWL